MWKRKTKEKAHTWISPDLESGLHKMNVDAAFAFAEDYGLRNHKSGFRMPKCLYQKYLRNVHIHFHHTRTRDHYKTITTVYGGDNSDRYTIIGSMSSTDNDNTPYHCRFVAPTGRLYASFCC